VIQELNRSAKFINDNARQESVKNAVLEVVGGHFRPEFINRIDELVVFEPLAKDQIQGIATIQLDLLRDRLRDRELGFVVEDDAMDKLTAAGFDPVYGARPLKRAIQQYIENPLAQAVLAGTFAPGDVIRAHLGSDGDTIVFEK